MSSFRVCVPPLRSPLHSPETPSESVMTELAPHASYEKPCTGGPESERSYRWPPRFPTPYSAFSAEFFGSRDLLAFRGGSTLFTLHLSSPSQTRLDLTPLAAIAFAPRSGFRPTSAASGRER